MIDGWQRQTPRPFGESVCRVWGGVVRHCVLRGERLELAVDVVELRLIPQRYERGSRLAAHGTLTVDASRDDVRAALEQLARTREAVVLQREDRGGLEMRLGELSTARAVTLADGSLLTSALTYSWRAP